MDRRRRVRAGGTPAAVSIALAARLRRGGDAAERSRHEAEQAWEEVRRERAASTRARSELHWLRNLAEVGASGSVETSLRRVLESATGLGGSAAAMLVLPRADGEPLVATFGLSADESSRELWACRPEETMRAPSRSPTGTREEEAAHDEFRLSGGLALPVLDHNDGRLGTLAVFWRRLEREITEEELERLEGLAGALGPSLRNVFRFDELRRAVDRDATGLPGRRTLGDALAVECAGRGATSTRSACCSCGRPASRRPSARRRTAPGDVRTPDLVHHLGGGRFAVVLPESSLGDAERVARRLRLSLGEGRTPTAVGRAPLRGRRGLAPRAGGVGARGRRDSYRNRPKSTEGC